MVSHRVIEAGDSVVYSSAKDFTVATINLSDNDVSSIRDALLMVGGAFAEAIKPVPPPPPPVNPDPIAELPTDGKTDCSRTLTRLLQQYRNVTLPSGKVFVLDGSSLIIPGGCTLRSEFGTQIRCVNPKASHNYIRVSDAAWMQNLDVVMVDGPISGTGSIILGMDATDLTFDNVRVRGPGDVQNVVNANQTCISLWNCNGVRANRLVVQDAMGAAYGLESIGGADHVYAMSEFDRNGFDGVKIMGSPAFGIPRNHRFIGCSASGNGQAILQKIGLEITGQRDLSGAPRYVFNYTVPGEFAMPPATGVPNGTTVVFSRLPKSAGVTMVIDGTKLSFVNAALCLRLIAFNGKWSWDWWGNGEGWDISGIGHSFESCVAADNEGGGIQVKPGPIPNSHTSDISFSNTRAYGTLNGNGFAVVNNTSGLFVPSNLSWVNCDAWDNSGAGFAFTTQLIRAVQMANVTSRGNRGHGLTMQEWCRDFVLSNVHLLGNGRDQAGAGWNWVLQAGKRLRATNVFMSGVDPVGQSLVGDDQVDNPANAKCQGLYCLGKTSNGEVQSDTRIDAIAHNHTRNANAVFYRDPATPGVPADFPNIRV